MATRSLHTTKSPEVLGSNKSRRRSTRRSEFELYYDC